MTAADVLHLPGHVELPTLASHRAVTTEVVHALELDECGECPEHVSPIPMAVMAVRYSQWGHDGLVTAACSTECAESVLEWLLRRRPDPKDQPRSIRLLIPAKYATTTLPCDPPSLAQTPPGPADPDEDPEFLLYDALRRLVQTMPNTATVDMSGRDGFEHGRNKLLAHISQLGLNRIETLARAA